MNNFDKFLQRAGIISFFTIELPIGAYDFARKLGDMTLYSQIGWFTDLEDVFSSDYRKYKGLVINNHFRIKHKAAFLDFGKHTAIATGYVTESSRGIKISVQVNSFKIAVFIYMLIAALYCITLLVNMMFSLIVDSALALIMLPFIAFFAGIAIVLPYLLLRNSTRRMHDFYQGQFQYLAQKSIQDR